MNPVNVMFPDSRPTFVVGIGASAGGLDALERFFRSMPVNSGMAFVVIQHLSPDFKSLMAEQLERYTTMPAILVTDRNKIAPNTIYLLPPKKDMVIEGDDLICTDRFTDKVLSLPINAFFRSLAAAWGEKAVAIVFSGTGSDGSAGIMDVRERGGLVLTQSEESSRFDGMPRSAVATGCVDVILSPEQMPEALNAYYRNPKIKFDYRSFQNKSLPEEGIATILDCLQSVYNIDFNFYKPQTIIRRIERRIALDPDHISIAEYGRRIQNNRAELDLLYKDLLIGVTRFFRDPEAFDMLRQKIIPSILDRRLNHDDEVRAWVCGCSTGEEAYSIAILFLEAFMGLGMEPQLKILATDLHRESIQFAAEGCFPGSSFTEVSEELRERYFIEQPDGSYKAIANLRKTLIFSVHNLLKDPPFTHMDLISCRNLLIYLQSSAQMRAIAFFHFALKLNGYLLLGSSEGLGELANQFRTVDSNWKIYSKIHQDIQTAELRAPLVYAPLKNIGNSGAKELRLGRVYDALLARFIPAGILVNEQHEAVYVFGEASHYLRKQAGRVSTDLFSMVSDSIRVTLKTALRSAEQKQTVIKLKNIRFQEGGVNTTINITIEPLLKVTENSTYYIIFIEQQAESLPPIIIEPQADIPFEIDNQSNAHIHHLETELQLTRESLQSTVEELEASNDELQAANEVLFASNEELQSTNEELHSVNEQLYSVNTKHEQKIQELNVVTSNLDNLIRSTDLATVFLDENCIIRLLTPKAVEIFSFMPGDVGRNLHHFNSLIPDESLYNDIASVIDGQPFIEKQLALEKGRNLLRRVTPYHDVNKKMVGIALTYIDISEIKKVQEALQFSEQKFRLLAENTSDWIFIMDENFHFIYSSPASLEITGFSPDEFVTNLDLLKAQLHPKHRANYDNYLLCLDEHNEHALDLKIIHNDGCERWIEYKCRSIPDINSKLRGYCGSIRDITTRKQDEEELHKWSHIFEHAGWGISVGSASGKIIELANPAFIEERGYKVEDFVQFPIAKLFTLEERVKLPNFIQMAHEKGHYTFESVHLRKDGSTFPVRIDMTAVKNDQEDVLYRVVNVQNITEQKRAEAELRIAATAFESQEGIFITDVNHNIIRVNKSFSRMTGYTATEVIGKSLNILRSEHHDDDFFAEMWRTVHRTGCWEGEIWNKLKHGEIYPERMLITAVFGEGGQLTHYVCSLTDITQSREAANEIQHLAFYDPLTRLPNRRLLQDRLTQAIIAGNRSGKIGALLFMDLDNFKNLNDTSGHDIGDMLLQEVANRLQSCVREGDTVARLSGDEFVIILQAIGETHTEAVAQTDMIANKLLTSISQPFQLVSQKYTTSSSIGITLFTDREFTKEELLKQADIAMYAAKAAGRNTLRYFNPEMQALISARFIQEKAIREAIDKEQFEPYFQVQSTHERKIVGAEVLIRWNHPSEGLTLPGEFIHIMEETGLIVPVGNWILQKACTQLKAWENHPLAFDLLLSVNVSARQFHQADFVSRTRQVIIDSGIKPDKLKLELTESLVLDDVNETITKMKALSELGIHFSMDDFGTGYSSLSNLKKLPIKELKIDQSFVRDIPGDKDDASIVQTIIAMAHNLGLNVIAEGVETEEQRAFLEQHDCSVCQGFLFSKPLPLDKFESLFQ